MLPQPKMPSQEQIPAVAPSGSGSPNELLFKTQDATQPIQPGQGPQPISPRDQALSAYRQVQQEGQPSQVDYHPSITRRIIGTLLGGASGFDPNAAITTPAGKLGHDITYGPYDKSVSEYQKKLAQKKEAYETEAGAETQEAKLGEVGAQKSAEVERGRAEVARKEEEEAKTREIQPGTPEFEGKMKQLQVQYPDTRFNKPPTPYTLKLKNGKSVVGYEGQGGQFKDSDGNIYGPNAIENAYKVGTEPKETTKPPREGEAGYIDKLAKKLHPDDENPELTPEEQLQAHKSYDTAGRKDTISDPDAAAFRRDVQMTNAKNTANRQYATQFSQASAHLDKLDQVKLLITTGNPESLAIAVPNVLTALISGTGTGVRITQAEINQILHARGWGENVEAFVKKISGQGALSSKQRQDLVGIMDDVKDKVVKKQKRLSDTMDKIDSAEKPSDISKAHIEHRKGELESDKQKTNELPGGITLDEINAEIEKRKKKPNAQ